jgi:tetratricopeptide (TPR) repeat protein
MTRILKNIYLIMNKVRYTEWIDSYVEGELNDADRTNFESELSVNRDLAIEYHLEKDLQKILSEEDLLDLRAKCIVAQTELNLSSRKFVKVVQFTRKYWYAAASILLIALIIGGFFLLNPGGYSAEKLFKMYYKSGETIGVSRSGNVNMVEALRYFSKNDFQTADGLFDEILANDPANIAVMYYSGISNIEIKDYQKAILMFESIINNGDNLYTENSEWYLGLSLLASGQIEKAEAKFNAIASSPGHFYNKDAKSILEKIGENEKNKIFLNNLFFLILPF